MFKKYELIVTQNQYRDDTLNKFVVSLLKNADGKPFKITGKFELVEGIDDSEGSESSVCLTL